MVLHLMCLDTMGKLWHTIRRADGTFFPFGSVSEAVLGENPGSLDPFAFQDVACTNVGDELHVAGLTNFGGIIHTIRRKVGTWFPFGDLSAVAQAPDGDVSSVAATGVNNQLRVCVALRQRNTQTLSTDQAVYHTARDSAGGWSPFTNAGGSFADVACSSAGGVLHFCGASFFQQDVGTHVLEHALQTGPDFAAPFTPFGNVRDVVLAQNPGSLDPGPSQQVSCGGHNGDLHICAISLGSLSHTIRRADGTFFPFGDVVAVVMSDNPGSPRPDGLLNGVSCAVVQDELHVTVIDGRGSIWHTIRDVNGRFSPFGNVIATVLAQNPGSPSPGTASVVAVADSF